MNRARIFAPSVGASVSRRGISSTRICFGINKLCKSTSEAIGQVKSGSTVLVGGFGFSGVPNTLVNALRDRPDITDLTVVSNNAGMPGVGLGM
ncbi:succinyl-CoA:3-ketoacid coenzyme A transferase like protein [Verticillium longisporum]|nr:succinyl-CoA:3-ketoacid coenzyme A transferase like protein [Verticillium longisporum]